MGYGSVWLAVVAAYVRNRRWAPRGMVAAAAGSLWYLWVGSLAGTVQLGLLALARGQRTR